MDLTAFYFLTTTLVLILEQEASIASPVSDQERAPPVGIPLAPALREKRCSCENLKDKECVYFCHIGIVWVDTPGQVVPYGVGSVRLRRGVVRCFCASSSDAECRRFCTPWSLHTHQDEKAFMKTSPSNLGEKTDDGLQVQKT